MIFSLNNKIYKLIFIRLKIYTHTIYYYNIKHFFCAIKLNILNFFSVFNIKSLKIFYEKIKFIL